MFFLLLQMVFIDVSIVIVHIDICDGVQDVVNDVVSNNVVYFLHVVANAVVELTLLF
jgi:hypothetical protein